MKPRIYAWISLAIVVVEFFLCFTGPLALVEKPEMLLLPPYSTGMSPEENDRMIAFIEKAIARTNSYSLVSQVAMKEYLTNNQIKLKPVIGNLVSINDYLSLAEKLNVKRVAAVSAYQFSTGLSVSIMIWDVRLREEIQRAEVTTDTFSSFLEGIGKNGTAFNLTELLTNKTKGIGILDWLFFLTLGVQLVSAILGFRGKKPGFLAEVMIIPSLFMFLFAYIYALNANMDYVQRFIATQGALHLAADTATEQLFAGIRYLPLLVLNAAVWFMDRFRGNRDRRPETAGEKAPRWSLLRVLFSALLFSLSFPSFLSLDGFGFLAWVSLVPLFLVLIHEKAAVSIVYMIAFGGFQALLINYWHGMYSYLSLYVTVILFTLEYAFFSIPLVWIVKRAGKWGFAVMPFIWVLFDYVRTQGYAGYPWGMPGASQYAFTPVIQIASVTGIWGVTFLIVLVNAGIAWAVAAPARGWTWHLPRPAQIFRRIKSPAGRDSGEKGLFRGVIPVMAAAGLTAICCVWGLFEMGRIDRLEKTAETVRLLLIQQNTDPRKYDFQENLNTLKRLTDSGLASTPLKPDLIVWSEGAVTPDIRLWSTEPGGWSDIIRDFTAYRESLGLHLVTGSRAQDREEVNGEVIEKNYNASYYFNTDDGSSWIYRKMHLVPFSEHFPFKKQFPALFDLLSTFEISNWDTGKELTVFHHPTFRFITPICFEDAFSQDVRRFVRSGVDVIVNISNDYWSLSPVEGIQHGTMALFRAVENRRPLVRATASGLTVHVDAAGRIKPGSPPPYTEGYMFADLHLMPDTLSGYTRFGDWFPVLSAAIVLVCLGVTMLISIQIKKEKSRVYRKQPAGLK